MIFVIKMHRKGKITFAMHFFLLNVFFVFFTAVPAISRTVLRGDVSEADSFFFKLPLSGR